MQKINFQNLPSTATPLNAQNMNAIQDNAETAINEVSQALNNLIQLGTINDGNGNLTIGNIGIEWGIVSVEPTSGSSPNYYGSTTVSFQNNYKYNPIMIACGGGGYTSINNITTISVGKTSGDVWMTASATTARNCRYLVMGQLAD